jgi:hypothetical protein
MQRASSSLITKKQKNAKKPNTKPRKADGDRRTKLRNRTLKFRTWNVQGCRINYGVDTRRKKKKRTSKENLDRRCTSSHENKTFRSRSVVKQKGMVFAFRKTATAVVGPEIELLEPYSPCQWGKGQESLSKH